MESVRVDKWLWAVRIFKSRTLATKMVKSGRVRINDGRIKPSSTVQVDDKVQVSKNGYNFEFLVKGILGKRVGAPLAIDYYEDLTPESELQKFKDEYIGKAPVENREKGAGRPTKKERREIDDYKGNLFDHPLLEDFFDESS